MISFKICYFFLPNLQVPLGLAITWAVAFLLTEAGTYNYKGCDINIPASNIVSEHCRKHISRMKQCRIDTSHAMKSSPWFNFPYPLQWGTPVFHWKMALVMCVVSLISSVDSVRLLSFFASFYFVSQTLFILTQNTLIVNLITSNRKNTVCWASCILYDVNAILYVKSCSLSFICSKLNQNYDLYLTKYLLSMGYTMR
jgi:hypothetical protein